MRRTLAWALLWAAGAWLALRLCGCVTVVDTDVDVDVDVDVDIGVSLPDGGVQVHHHLDLWADEDGGQ